MADDPELRVLGWLIANTDGASAQLALARACSRDGRHAESLVHVGIASDAIHLSHPAIVPDPVLLAKVLQRFFLEA